MKKHITATFKSIYYLFHTVLFKYTGCEHILRPIIQVALYLIPLFVCMYLTYSNSWHMASGIFLIIAWGTMTMIGYDIQSGSFDEESMGISALLLAITFIFSIPPLFLSHTTNTVRIVPDSVIHRNNSEVIIFSGNNELNSYIAYDYLNPHIMICKDEKYNSWNIRMSDSWYICP